MHTDSFSYGNITALSSAKSQLVPFIVSMYHLPHHYVHLKHRGHHSPCTQHTECRQSCHLIENAMRTDRGSLHTSNLALYHGYRARITRPEYLSYTVQYTLKSPNCIINGPISLFCCGKNLSARDNLFLKCWKLFSLLYRTITRKEKTGPIQHVHRQQPVLAYRFRT